MFSNNSNTDKPEFVKNALKPFLIIHMKCMPYKTNLTEAKKKKLYIKQCVVFDYLEKTHE